MPRRPSPRLDDLRSSDLEEAGLGAPEAAAVLEACAAACAVHDQPEERWTALSRHTLRPDHPHPLHRLLFAACYTGRPEERGPAPAWVPQYEEQRRSRVHQLKPDCDFASFHRWTREAPEAFWSAILEALQLQLDRAPEAILGDATSADQQRWLLGAEGNAGAWCFAGRDPERTALVAQGEEGALRRLTLGELERRSRRVAAALQQLGLGPGAAVAIDMPMTVESVEIYLGIVRMGGVVVSIADSFAPPEIATRLRISQAQLIFTQDCIVRGSKRLPLYTRVCEAEAPRAIVLSASRALSVDLRPGDLGWEDFFAGVEEDPSFTAHTASLDEPTNILFSSGTTGEPKAIPWSHITPIKAAADGLAHHDIREGDVVAWPTNLGWMMGPWLIYASLLNNATIALFESLPTSAGFCRFVQDAGVTMLGVVPSLVRAWRANGATEGLDWTAIRCFSSTGEASNRDDSLWLMARARYKPVIEYCGGTEIGGGYVCGSMLQPQAPSTFSTPAIGCFFYLLDERGQPCDEGELALVPPQFGSSVELLNRDHDRNYFEGMPQGPCGEVLRRHGDQMAHLGGGYFQAQGRVDDTMNLGGIKTSSADIERCAAGVEGVEECAAIAVPPPGGGPSQLVLYLVPTHDSKAAEAELAQAIQRRIRSELNPLFKLHETCSIEALPRTASGKVMRRTLRRRHLASKPSV